MISRRGVHHFAPLHVAAAAERGVVEAHGDVALGRNGPRDARIDRIGGIAADAAGKAPNGNGISSKLSDIATRSAVDVNSRAAGTFKSAIDGFGTLETGSSRSISASSANGGFARLPGPNISDPDITAFATALDSTARLIEQNSTDAAARSEQHLANSNLSARLQTAVQSYDQRTQADNNAIAARHAYDAQVHERVKEMIVDARSRAAARTGTTAEASSSPIISATSSSGTSYSSPTQSPSSTILTSGADCPGGNGRYANGTCSHELGSNPGIGPH